MDGEDFGGWGAILTQRRRGEIPACAGMTVGGGGDTPVCDLCYIRMPFTADRETGRPGERLAGAGADRLLRIACDDDD